MGHDEHVDHPVELMLHPDPVVQYELKRLKQDYEKGKLTREQYEAEKDRKMHGQGAPPLPPKLVKLILASTADPAS